MCGKLQLFGLDSTHFKFLTGSDDQDVFVLGGFPRGSVKIAGVFFLKKGSGKYIATALSRIQEEAAKLGHKFSPKSFFTDDSPAGEYLSLKNPSRDSLQLAVMLL